MSGPVYAPGTVALATVRGVENVRVMATYDGWYSTQPLLKVGHVWHSPDDVTDVRTLVALDPDDVGQVKTLVETYYAQDSGSEHTDMHLALRTLAPKLVPALLDEPRGIGAVVGDQRGDWWIGDHTGWRRSSGGPYLPWPEVGAVHVLSEGVTP